MMTNTTFSSFLSSLIVLRLFVVVMLLLMGSSSQAFLPVANSSTRRDTSIVKMTQKLSDIDLMAIENVAELCLQAEEALATECDLEEHEALVNQLTEQRKLLSDQVNYLDDLLARLQGASP